MDPYVLPKKVIESSIFVDLSEHGSILNVQFSPYEWSQDVILIAFRNKIFVGVVCFNDAIELKKLEEIHHNVMCTSMYLSPETSINSLPVHIQFATAGKDDFLIRIFSGDLNEKFVCKLLKGHSKYINDICYNNENTYFSSVSDDNTARVWSIADNYECIANFALTSPGMSTSWHSDDVSKLMVAEKNGIIRFYNVATQRPIVSLDIGKGLCAAHWSPSNSQFIASLNQGELCLWDIRKPSCPKHALIYSHNGGFVKISPQGELIGSVNRLENKLKVIHSSTFQTRLVTKVTLPTNVSWHFRLPLICIGDDRLLRFWKVLPK